MRVQCVDGFGPRSRESVTSALSSDSRSGRSHLARRAIGGCYFHFGAYPDSSRLFIYIRLVCSVRSEIFPFADSHASGSFGSRRDAIETCARSRLARALIATYEIIGLSVKDGKERDRVIIRLDRTIDANRGSIFSSLFLCFSLSLAGSATRR